LAVKNEQLHEWLFQSLEVEIGGQQIYQNAHENAVTPELKEEWQKYLSETEDHERILRETFEKLGLDPEKDTPGRRVARHKAQALVQAMQMAREAGPPEAGELVAAECVVEAETKDHQDWELIGRVAEELSGKEADALKEAYEQVEDQEDEHLYHTMGWARELWIKSLGMPAVIPPPEEQKKVTTQIGAARAENAREEMLKK
jgi:hypothetical protein